MDAELDYLLAIANRKRVPVARVVITDVQTITESETNVDIASIVADAGSAIATVTTEETHGVAPGEILTIANNISDAAIDVISGDGTTATVACSQPHALVDQGSATIANNTASFTDAAATGDGSTATIVTAEPHGFADGGIIDIGYTVAGEPSPITVGISSITAPNDNGAFATVVTTSPHTFVNGQQVTISGIPTGDGTISQISANFPTSGNSIVFSPSLPAVGDSVIIDGNLFNAPLINPVTRAAVITGNGTTATAVTALTALPPEFTTGAAIEITGVRAHGTIVQIAASGTSFTADTFTAHGMSVGSSVTIHGITGPSSQTRFNGTWTVTAVPSAGQFTVTTPFSSSVTFNPAPATWNGVSGFNGSWLISSVGTITISSVVYMTVSFAATPIVNVAGTPTYGTGGVIATASAYNGTFTVTATSGASFEIAFASGSTTEIYYGGNWTTGLGLNGVQTITSIDDSLTFEFATLSSASEVTSGYATGTSGFDQVDVTIAYQDEITFTYSCAADTAGVAVAGYNGSGLSGFNGVQTPITYIDGFTFSFLSSTQATVDGGNLSGNSGFNASPITVLTVPSTTTFTYENLFAGNAGTTIPYVYGSTGATGSITTYDTSYVGITSTQLYWDQPATFSTNGMVASSRGITVPTAGWYKIICRIEFIMPSAYVADAAYAYADIYADDVLIARSTRINQQTPINEYSLLVSDLQFLLANQTISILATAFAPLNSGQMYAFGFESMVLTYLAAVLVST
jgi:hypothetical protein